MFHPCGEELLLRITTCLAQNGYHKEVGVMVQLNKAFWNDEQIWDAYKDVPGASGRTRLMYASLTGLLDRVTWLLARGANLNMRDSSELSWPALIWGCGGGSLAVIRELLDKGADVNMIAAGGLTALMLASQTGELGIVRELCLTGVPL